MPVITALKKNILLWSHEVGSSSSHIIRERCGCVAAVATSWSKGEKHRRRNTTTCFLRKEIGDAIVFVCVRERARCSSCCDAVDEQDPLALLSLFRAAAANESTLTSKRDPSLRSTSFRVICLRFLLHRFSPLASCPIHDASSFCCIYQILFIQESRWKLITSAGECEGFDGLDSETPATRRSNVLIARLPLYQNDS